MGIEKISKRTLLTPDKALASPDGGIAFAEKKTILTTTNLTGMFATPVNVIPAPPANQALVVDVILFQMRPGGTPFSAGGAVTFVYDGTSVNPHSGNVPAATVNSASASETQLPPPAATIQVPPGVGLDITNAGGAFAGGNGTAVVKIFYHLVPQA